MANMDLNTLSIGALTKLYNEMADKPVKSFKNKTIAMERVAAIGTASAMEVVLPGVWQVDASAARIDPKEDAEETQTAEQVVEAPKPKKTKKEKKQRAEYAETAKITVVKAVEAREGSKRAARAAVLQDGQTVGEYLTAAHEANGKIRSRHRYHADLRRLVAKGNITIA